MFDSFNDQFNSVALHVVELYNLTINVYSVTSLSRIIQRVGIYGNGDNIVNIVMFG